MDVVPSVFSRIIEGQLPGHFVHRDERCVAILSINPIAPGHTLVVPRREVDLWTDLTEDETAHLMVVARRIGIAQRRVLGCERVGLIVAGFEVPHCHLHVIPANSMDDLDFSRAAATTDRVALDEMASDLGAALAPDAP